ncbi:MAG: DUF427 domain-containing protein [Gammaproteobacteria bacterium]|jgi:uncharacterized protein (DUF427 family)|nr:DUF427 domain-containing protein [Gammaproteobacteria bacterium]
MWEYRGQKRPPFAEPVGAGQESVWDFPRPPKAVPCNRTVEVSHNGIVIGRSTKTYRVLETASPPTFYLPANDVDWPQLVKAPGSSLCEWKGLAAYWALTLDPSGAPVAWSYGDPHQEFEMLRAHASFYPGRVACYVDGERVRPQPGEFYGGWVTSELVGPFKGAAGSQHW